MPDRRGNGATSSGAGRWVGILIGIIILVALVAWIYGWFGGEEEVLVETEQPETLEGAEAVVIPELEAEEVITGEEDLEEALEPEVFDEVELGEPAGDLTEGLEPAEDEALIDEGVIEEDEGLLEGETAIGEQGVLEGAIDLGVADDPELPGDELIEDGSPLGEDTDVIVVPLEEEQ